MTSFTTVTSSTRSHARKTGVGGITRDNARGEYEDFRTSGRKVISDGKLGLIAGRLFGGLLSPDDTGAFLVLTVGEPAAIPLGN